MEAWGSFDGRAPSATPFSSSLPYAAAKRLLDIVLAAILLLLFLPLLLTIALAVRLTSAGPALHWSQRVGVDGRLFAMPKFRTMHLGTPIVTTHLLPNARARLTPAGGVLRRLSLDELPQLWSVLRGQMSLVGPRPALFNQHDLIALRRIAGVDRVRPGITGWAQVNGRDHVSVAGKVLLDTHYARRRSLRHDCAILVRTVPCVLLGHGISH